MKIKLLLGFLYFLLVFSQPANAGWQPVPDFGGGTREITTYFTLNNKGYAGCGRNNTGEKTDLWEFNGSSWTQKADYPGKSFLCDQEFDI